MIAPTAFVANVLQGCVICWSPYLPHWFPPTDLWIPDPPAITQPQRASTPHKARPVPKARTITIPGYAPPLRIPQWLNPKGF